MSDLLERLMNADTEELHGYAAVELGQLLGEAADKIEKLQAVRQAAVRAHCEFFSAWTRPETLLERMRDLGAAIRAHDECPVCHGEAKLEQYNCPKCHGR